MRISFLRVVPIKSGMGGCNQHFRVCVGQFAGGGVSVVMPMVVTPVVLCGASGGLCMSLRIFALSCRLLFSYVMPGRNYMKVTKHFLQGG